MDSISEQAVEYLAGCDYEYDDEDLEALKALLAKLYSDGYLDGKRDATK